MRQYGKGNLQGGELTRTTNVGTLFTPAMVAASSILLLILIGTIFAGFLAPYDPEAIDLSLSYGPITPEHILGTDNVGRDSLSRLLFGGRTAITNAFLVVGVTVSVGIPLGLLCGYYGGALDGVIMRIWDVILSFPPLLLGFLFVAMFGRGSTASILALGIAWIPMISRLARNLTIAERNKTYVLAAKSFGFSDARVIFRHILPNCTSTLLAELTVDIGYAIIVLASLSFLGLGVQAPTSDWGLMLQESLVYVRQSPLQTVIPSVAIGLMIVSLNIVSDSIQLYLDPEQRKLPSFERFLKKHGTHS
ncbi:MAG: ABC transporter permease [Clostridiales Family XIII bacterium]|jgi:peptide/nickel transport system permease protein|nr:ABC transporter permease [Clostridiales Family XIII bacterium]